jgi:hypothetical protein
MFGAGLPQIAALEGDAKSYAERLFDFKDVGPLAPAAAKRAIREPVLAEGAEIGDDALQMIVETTNGYPYFLQEWGKHAWNVALPPRNTAGDVEAANRGATEALDRSFFRVRFDRLTQLEQNYLRTMADLGPGPHRSGQIAERLGRKVENAGPVRDGLIRNGMIWSPAHGLTAFTVPIFDQFMRRAMPQWHAPSARRPKARPAKGV